MMFHVEQKRNKVKTTTQTPAIKKMFHIEQAAPFLKKTLLDFFI